MKMKIKIDTKALARVLVGLCALSLSPATAGTSKVEVRWNELSPLILAHTVSLVLPGGTTVAGEVESVRDDSLTLDVRKTSNSKVQPKGTASIPRASVTTLQIDGSEGIGWANPRCGGRSACRPCGRERDCRAYVQYRRPRGRHPHGGRGRRDHGRLLFGQKHGPAHDDHPRRQRVTIQGAAVQGPGRGRGGSGHRRTAHDGT